MGKIIKVYLEFSFRCNLKCKFCYAGDIQSTENITTNYFDFKEEKDIHSNLVKIFCDKGGVYDVDILGGESLLNIKFVSIIEYIKQNFKIRNINLTTNATLLNNILIISLIKAGITHFRVSIHGTEEIHNNLVGKNVFDKVISSLQLLTNNNADIIVIFVYNNFNKRDLLTLMILLFNKKIVFNNLFIEFVEFSGYGLKNIKKLNMVYDRKLKLFFNKQLLYVKKIFPSINISLSNLPKCMLNKEFHHFIDDDYSLEDNFELYIPRLARKVFQNFSKEELNFLVEKNIQNGYRISRQFKLENKYIPEKCFSCEYQKNCYLMIKESILYDYLGLKSHKRKHYFELNDSIISN